MLHKSIKKKLSALIVFAMILSIFSTNYVALAAAESNVSLSDIDDSYAQAEIAALVEKDIISGFEDGTFKPTETMTRAQLAKVLVLSLGLKEDAAGAAKFQDVAEKKWFSGYVGALVKSEITQGTSAVAFSPDKSVSREELAVFFIRAFGWEEKAEAVPLDKSLTDLADVSSWAKASVSFAYQIGFIKGIENTDGTFRYNPDGNADRQALARLAYEFVVNKAVYEGKAEQLLKEEDKQVKGTGTSSTGNGNGGIDSTGGTGGTGGTGNSSGVDNSISAPGEYSLGDVTGDVTISAAGVVLRDTNINGNLFLESGIGNGDVTLDNVTVSGETRIYGGGPNSIHISDSVLATVIVNKNDGSIRLVIEDGTNVQQIELYSGAAIEATATGEVGIVNVARSVPQNAQVSFNGTFDNIHVRASQVAIEFAEGSSIGDLTVFEEAMNATFNLSSGSAISHAVINAIVSFAGTGTLTSSLVNVDGVDFNGLIIKPAIVADPTVRSIVYTPAQVHLSAVESTYQIVLTGLRNDESRKDITSTSVWYSDDATVAEVVYGQVTAKSEGSTYIHATYGEYEVQIPVTVSVYRPNEVYPTISAISVTNGVIDVAFSEDIADVVLENFIVTATVSGSTYALHNLQYSNGQLIFDPVDSYGHTLYVTVDSNADKTKFAGSQSGNMKLPTGFGGRIKDVNGVSVEGLTISFRRGLNITAGTIAGTAVTDANGRYYIELAPGVYTGELGGDGTAYIKTYLIGVAAVNVKNLNQNQTAIKVPNASETRIVLTWGENPVDLDSHLMGPTVDGGQFYVWYRNTEYSNEEMTIVDLDLDDVNSYGPETTTIRQDAVGTYKFYVHHYSGTSTLRASGAKIEVFRGDVNAPTEVYMIPTGAGNESYWLVFEMTIDADGNVEFTAVNELTDVNPNPTQDEI